MKHFLFYYHQYSLPQGNFNADLAPQLSIFFFEEALYHLSYLSTLLAGLMQILREYPVSMQNKQLKVIREKQQLVTSKTPCSTGD